MGQAARGGAVADGTVVYEWWWMLVVVQWGSAGVVWWVAASGCLSGLGRRWGGVGRRWWVRCFQVSRAAGGVGRWKTMGRVGAEAGLRRGRGRRGAGVC